MTVNYTPLLGLAQPVTGTESGTWGDTINASLTALLETAIAGTKTADVTSGNWTLTDIDGADDTARAAVLIPTGTNGATTRSILAPNQSKIYVIINQATGSVVIKGVTGPTTGVTITAGSQALVAWNGSDFVNITPAVSGYLPLTGGTMTGTITFAAGQLIPASSVVRSAKTSAYTVVAGDKGTLIEVTSGTFTLSLTAAATLGSGWWCYVSNIGTGLITIDPNSTETITVNGEALSTWVQWTNEIGLLQCDGTNFHYYQLQKGAITQTVSSAVSSIVFSGCLAYRKNIILSWDNGDLSAANQIKLLLNTSVAPANSYGFLNTAGSLSAITGASDNFTFGGNAGAGYGATARFQGQAMFTLSDNAVVAVINNKYFLSPNLNGGQTTSLFSSVNRTSITDITITPNSANFTSGTFTLKEL